MGTFTLLYDFSNIPIDELFTSDIGFGKEIMENIHKFTVCEYYIDDRHACVYDMLCLVGNDTDIKLQCNGTQMVIEYNTKFMFARKIISNDDGCTLITQTKKSMFDFEGIYKNDRIRWDLFMYVHNGHAIGTMCVNGYLINYIVAEKSCGKCRFLFTYAHEFTAKMQWLLTVFLHEQIQNDYTHTIQEQVFANDYLVKMILRY